MTKGTRRLHEFQLDGTGSAGNTGDGEVAVVDDLTILGIHIGNDDLICIGIVDANGGDALLRLDQTLLNGEGTDAGGDVAAVAFVAHQGLVHADLGEGVVHIRVGPIGLFNDGYLAGDGLCAAQTVYLFLVRAAHQLQQQRLPEGLVLGKILFQNVDALAGAAPENGDGKGALCVVHCNDLLCCLEALIHSARAGSARFFSSRRFKKRRNTVCISRFLNCTDGEEDPLSSRRRMIQRFLRFRFFLRPL